MRRSPPSPLSLCVALSLLSLAPAGRAEPIAGHLDEVLVWNIKALQTTAAAPFNPPLESRNLAIVHAVVFDAVNSIVGDYSAYAVRQNAPQGASPSAAAAAAAHFALVELYPAQRASLDEALVVSLAAIPDGPAKTAGTALGESAARRILTLRSADGAAEAIVAPYVPIAAPGHWQPTLRPSPPPTGPDPGLPGLSALDPGWGAVRPFMLTKGSQYRPEAPPAPTSARYQRDFNEIREIGSRTSATRTQAQTDLARFWIATANQNWNPAARQVSIGKGLSLSQNARMFALLNMAIADAFVASWDAKFHYNQWRPITGIRAADTDGNGLTGADASWWPLLVTPPFPDYVAGHAVAGGAAEAVLSHVLGDEPGVTMRLTSPTAAGVVLTYTRFTDISKDVVDARVFGGIHWRTSDTRGRSVGRKVGRFGVHGFLRPVRGDVDRCDCDHGEDDDDP
jgi:hypothetical protein